MFHNFEKTFSGEIIDPDNLTIKEQIGEGEFMFAVFYSDLFYLPT